MTYQPASSTGSCRCRCPGSPRGRDRRATLYKYFPDVESILLTWHEEHVDAHLDHLDALRSGVGDPMQRLEAVLEAYARICHHRAQHGVADLGQLLHGGDRVAAPHRRLHGLFRDLVTECVTAGAVRDDVAPEELAHYCIHALDAAGSLPSGAAVRRLVAVTTAGLAADARPARRPRQR
jgi:AcrR family transcriptional regulator